MYKVNIYQAVVIQDHNKEVFSFADDIKNIFGLENIDGLQKVNDNVVIKINKEENGDYTIMPYKKVLESQYSSMKDIRKDYQIFGKGVGLHETGQFSVIIEIIKM
ncbi:hypothetical protein PQ692_14420 (plasmid) [Thermoanaerobacterium thermosaccharolyticum]|uniref:hypothetical protein n=1 Tax=Thermoanaerobacterium thermosaccharolyticum TaxID=1517 RepID=UPI003D2A6B08